MQTSAMKACFQIAECSFSSAKLRFSLHISKFYPPFLPITTKKKDWILSHERNPVCVNDMFLPMNVYAKSYKRVGSLYSSEPKSRRIKPYPPSEP